MAQPAHPGTTGLHPLVHHLEQSQLFVDTYYDWKSFGKNPGLKKPLDFSFAQALANAFRTARTHRALIL